MSVLQIQKGLLSLIKVGSFSDNYSYIDKCIGYNYEGMENTTLTGNCDPDRFTTKRVIVIEMK